MTSAPVRAPLADHLLPPQNAAPLFTGYQPAPLPGFAEDWYRCYLDQFVFELHGAPPAPSQP